MTPCRAAGHNTGALLLCLGLCLPSPGAAAEDDIVELKRAIEQLQAQNRELARRIAVLEAGKAERKQMARPEPAPKKIQSQPEQKAAQVEAPEKITKAPPSAPAKTESRATLEERVKELEVGKTAEEDAVRSIIRSSLSTMGPRINEFVSLGGSLEITAGRSSDFSGTSTDSITVSTAEVDLEVRANEWMVGNLTLAFQSGTSTLFPTTPGFNAPSTTGVDRNHAGQGIRHDRRRTEISTLYQDRP
jgi:hypothetical protein